MPKKGITSSHLSLTNKEKDALENDLKHFGYLLPTNDEELEEFQKIYGTTQVMFPEHLKNLDFLFKKKVDTSNWVPVKKSISRSDKGVGQKTPVRSIKSNTYFKKLILCAEIASQLYNERTFGHVKFVKIIYLCEEVCNMQLNSNYGKFVAGPLDSKSMYSVDAEFKKRKWFSVTKNNYGGYEYKPLENAEDYKKYYLNYYSDKAPGINNIINLFRKQKTDFCEIVATLFASWKELLSKNNLVNEATLLKKFYAWSEAKKRFKEPELINAITWMKDNNIVPII